MSDGPSTAAPEPVPSATLDGKPRAGCWFFTLPVFVAIATIVAYFVTFFIGAQGTTPAGDRVVMTYAGCPEAMEVVRARVDKMGLGEPELATTDGGFTVTATLPGVDATVDAEIPDTLARTGELTIVPRGDDGAEPLFTNADVEEAYMTLEELGTVLTVVQLKPEQTQDLRRHMDRDQDGAVVVYIDGKPVYTLKNYPATSSGRVKIYPAADDPRALHVAAEWGVVLDSGPLPCKVDLVGTQPAG